MSALLRCEKCENVDNLEFNYPNGKHLTGSGQLIPLYCTICLKLPWHNRFPIEKYNEEFHTVVNPNPTFEEVEESS